ncbi:UDP-galactose/UDP-glucose transporter 7-like [Octopus sinensis]|uniref:UDP-galactose/UDP-glucose transporter 7-like n=1 Tax=Octopus sinensis TaxID=2607531 RepID=A0A6P7TK18_9MOLL|nr:UDP-galactose/UDP-glucose transporter 7-like [Octopus sinensis]XP_036369884.1 UDP-galactose/UDP-glucose transporter 7-like [Octopus sinensis]
MGGKTSYVKGVAAAFFYGTCSVLMAFLNKILMDTYGFHFPMCIMVVQMSLTVVLLYALRATQLVSIPSYTFKDGRLFLLPAVFYAANSVLGLFSLSHMNVAMYGVLKRCVPLATLLLSVILLRKSWPSFLTLISIILLTVGCVVAGSGDLKFHFGGYLSGGLSNMTQALYLLLVQQYTETSSNTLHILLLNSINSLPLLTMALLVSGEAQQVAVFLHANHKPFILTLIVIALCGILLNYSLFLCTNHTSALTTSVVGGMKALAQTLIGVFTFGGVSPNLLTKLGISLNLCGSLLYVVAKYVDRKHIDLLGHLKKVASLASMEDLERLHSSSQKENTSTNTDNNNTDGTKSETSSTETMTVSSESSHSSPTATTVAVNVTNR